MTKQIIHTRAAPEPVGPYAQAVRAGDWLYLSGQLPIHPGSGRLVSGDIRVQTEQVMRNMERILAAAGADFAKVVKITIYLEDMRHFPAVNEVYAHYVQDAPPARACIQAKLPKDAGIEMEAVAFLG